MFIFPPQISVAILFCGDGLPSPPRKDAPVTFHPRFFSEFERQPNSSWDLASRLFWDGVDRW